MTLRTDTTKPEDTLNLAAKIGAKLRGGEVIELVSDLGGGKTVFVRGLARGMGSKDQVASPTFTISREYKAIKSSPKSFGEDASKEESSSGQSGTAKYRDGAIAEDDEAGASRDRGVSDSVRKQSDSSNILWLHHFDFYRLNEAGIVADELAESINDPKIAVVIEWGEAVKDVLPKDKLRVEITKTGDESRKISISAAESHRHLLG